jgi:hypothetical protein
MSIDLLPALRPDRVAWNKSRIIGQKRPLLPRHVWSIRVRLEMAGYARDLALFNLAVDSKLIPCLLREQSGQAKGAQEDTPTVAEPISIELRATGGKPRWTLLHHNEGFEAGV